MFFLVTYKEKDITGNRTVIPETSRRNVISYFNLIISLISFYFKRWPRSYIQPVCERPLWFFDLGTNYAPCLLF